MKNRGLSKESPLFIFFEIKGESIYDRKYIEREYTANGKHLIINNEKQNKVVRTKLKRILKVENSNPNVFEQKITSIRQELVKELNNI